jgi:hypothetical protein
LAAKQASDFQYETMGEALELWGGADDPNTNALVAFQGLECVPLDIVDWLHGAATVNGPKGSVDVGVNDPNLFHLVRYGLQTDVVMVVRIAALGGWVTLKATHRRGCAEEPTCA